MKQTSILEACEEGQLIPVFFSPKSTSLLDYFYMLAEGNKFKDKLKEVHKKFGGRGDGEFVIFFTTNSSPIVTGIPFRNSPIPNIFEAKFKAGTIIEIKEIL